MPLNRPECRPQKFVMVTQVAAGRLVPPFNPRASRCHPPIHQPACQDGATRQFVSGRVRQEVRNSATRQFRAPRRTESVAKMVPPASSEGRLVPGWLVPALNPPDCQNGATRQFGAPPTWCHPPTRNGQLVPPPSSEVQAWCHPPIRGAEVASSIRASPPRVAPVRPL